MKKTKEFNNISKELEKEISLKPGEKAVFKLLNIKPDTNNPGRFLIPSAVSIREIDRVNDPNLDEWVDVAHITSVNREGKPYIEPIHFTKDNMGILELHGESPTDVEKAAYLRLSSYNESNVNRDKSISPAFFEINTKKDAEKKRASRSDRLTAMTTAAALSDDEAKEIYAALNLDSSEDIGLIREYLEDMAEKTPDVFNTHFSDKTRQIKATLRKAVDAGALALDKPGSKFVWAATNETAFTFAKKAGAEPYVEFADFILTGKNGDKLFEEIKKALNAKKK
jgi:hypothetical protein